MTSTARRRWSRELEIEIDGIALSRQGPVLVHGYEPPAGGMWIDEVIPGKLAALDRGTGETIWQSPCEVGYGRGFGAGFGENGEVLVLGPSGSGHRIVRMNAETGELLGAEGIEAFDDAQVYEDVCICASAGQVIAVSTVMMSEAWRFRMEGHRFHQVGRTGDRILVVHSNRKTQQKGVLALDVVTGELVEQVIEPCLAEVHQMAVDGGHMALLTADVAGLLTPELATTFLADLARRENRYGDPVTDTLTLLGMTVGEEGARAAWYEILSTEAGQDLPDASITVDSGKLYDSSGAMVEVRDLLSGRALGDWTIPGLDEQVGWQVSEGAGLLAEENRISIFELPA